MEKQAQKKEWFDEWFDTIYYHILYKNRDYTEAGRFLDNLITYFDLSANAKILDLACGKGRHSIYLNEKGFDVTGVDLSEQNITFAKTKENNTLHFDIHDMRDIYRPETFDYVFNLFTSFGYFDSIDENLDVIRATVASLKPGGKLLIDFLNPYVVVNHLVEAEDKTIDNIHFKISREYTDDQYIVKNISVDDHGQHFDYMEKVKAIRRTDFLNYFDANGLKVLDLFGDYSLAPYEKEKSDRLIFVIQKPA
ncbi:class I SAM-dependent methyltransferase [Reichenbachiella agariperforans]|uniref:class I SAM-dependent methyltransferase n=1 Tax=Reichenbachiella agariperforans TaxID=156994 RepID=UPI001C0947EC|nr:class I SAM-dependent methyltransferase [Reichenbachiella agariperforans]MBU2915908.1 class I SAM-dependent methyltransferase [Reichenbachiella agariperforans]